MNEQDITLMDLPTKPRSRLYYYQGNFYYPLDVSIDLKARVRFKIKQFKKDNTELFKNDRAHPDYKSVVQLFDEQIGKFTNENN